MVTGAGRAVCAMRAICSSFSRWRSILLGAYWARRLNALRALGLHLWALDRTLHTRRRLWARRTFGALWAQRHGEVAGVARILCSL
jgi:hypothetical protein